MLVMWKYKLMMEVIAIMSQSFSMLVVMFFLKESFESNMQFWVGYQHLSISMFMIRFGFITRKE